MEAVTSNKGALVISEVVHDDVEPVGNKGWQNRLSAESSS